MDRLDQFLIFIIPGISTIFHKYKPPILLNKQNCILPVNFSKTEEIN